MLPRDGPPERLGHDPEGDAYTAWRRPHLGGGSGERSCFRTVFDPALLLHLQMDTHRSEVATWKDIPQDAPSIVEWWRRLDSIYGIQEQDRGQWQDASLAQVLARTSPDRVRRLAADFRFDYILAERHPPLPWKAVYRNRFYTIYDLSR